MNYNIITFDSVTSTNDIASKGNYPEGTIIVAHSQSEGRGQRGNRWVSRPGDNLTFSLVVEPTHIHVGEQFVISMIASLASADAIRQAGVECMVKWPNDLYVDNRKVGGILIEHSLQGEYLTESVIGIGINIKQTEFDPSLPNPVSLSIMGRCDQTPDSILKLFCYHFSVRYKQSYQQLFTDYMARLWRRDGVHRFSDTAGEFMARIADIDPHTGMLTLQDNQGVPREYWFKEVEQIIEKNV